MISPKLSGFDFLYIEKLVELANRHQAVNLIGPHESFECAQPLKDAISHFVLQDLNQATSPFGFLELREKVAWKLKNDYGHSYDASSGITITAGINQAIYAAISALVREGDQVIVFEPTSNHFVPAIEMCGGDPVYIKMKEPSFFIDWEDVQKMINGKTRLILLSSPHNPTGWVMSELDNIRLQRIISGTKIIVINDETYQHLIFDGEAHQSMSAYPKLSEQSIVVASLSETFRLAAWPLAYVAAPADVTKEIRKVLQLMSQGVNSAIQRSLASVYDQKALFAEQSAIFQQKRDLFIEAIEESKFKAVPSKGSCYLLIGINDATRLSDKEFAAELIEKQGVATVPLSVFNHEKNKNQFLRIDLTQPDEVLTEAAQRLCRV